MLKEQDASEISHESISSLEMAEKNSTSAPSHQLLFMLCNRQEGVFILVV